MVAGHHGQWRPVTYFISASSVSDWKVGCAADVRYATGSAATERIASEMRRMRERILPTPTETPPRAPGMIESLTETLIALQHHLANCQRQLTPPEVMIIPRMQGVGLFDFHRAGELIAEGERATREALKL